LLGSNVLVDVRIVVHQFVSEAGAATIRDLPANVIVAAAVH